MTDNARLRALLKQHHITQADIASVTGKHRSSISKKLVDIEPWQLKEIVKVTEALQLTIVDAWEIFVAGHPLTAKEKAYLLPAPPYGKLTEEEIDRIAERLSQVTEQKGDKGA